MTVLKNDAALLSENGKCTAMRAPLLTGLILAMAPQAFAAPEGNLWLPLTRSEIIQLTVGATNEDSLEIETSDVQKAKLNGFLPPDHTIWIASNPAIPLGIVMAGRDQSIDALRITLPVVNHSRAQSERVSAIMVTLFKRLYPDWEDAAKWLLDSALETWQKRTVIRKQISGITNATFGVAPDIVVYTVTTRDQCVPDPTRGNPFERLIC